MLLQPIAKMTFQTIKKVTQKSSLNCKMQLGFITVRFLQIKMSMTSTKKKVKKNRLINDTMIPKMWPKGPVQHRIVKGIVIVSPQKPKVMKTAEINCLKILRFWESTPSCSYRTMPQTRMIPMGNVTIQTTVCRIATLVSTVVMQSTSLKEFSVQVEFNSMMVSIAFKVETEGNFILLSNFAL